MHIASLFNAPGWAASGLRPNRVVRVWLFIILGALSLAPRAAQALPFTVIYADAAGEGFNDATLGASRKAAFQAAVNNWSLRLNGNVPVKVQASFDPQGGAANAAVLGQGAPVQIRDFVGVPKPGVFYPLSLANQLAGVELNPNGVAITIRFNSDVDNATVLGATNYYYGTDGNSTIHIDFYSVAVHELGHGLGFVSGFANNDGTIPDGFPTLYTTLLGTGPTAAATRLTALTVAARSAALVGGNLYSVGPNAIAAAGAGGLRIFSPNPFQPGSSVSHLNEQTYSPAPGGTATSNLNEMMTPVATTKTHDPGPLALAVFKDMGYGFTAAALTMTVAPATFLESAGPNASTVTVTRNSGINTALTVTLTKTASTRVSIPLTLTIPALAPSATFKVAAVDNTVADGSQAVTLTAAAAGFTSATAGVTVTDNNDPLPPTVSSFTPLTGPPGTVVTVTGTNLTGATSAKVNATAATVTVVSAISVRVTVPSGATTGKISVTTPGGTGASVANFTVTAPVLAVTGFSPAGGGPGTLVTVSGTNFSGVTAVKFNTASAAFTVQSTTSLQTTVPFGASVGKISVTTAAGTASSAANFAVTPPPTIATITPASGPPGTVVTVTGTNLTGTTTVKLGLLAATFNAVTATSLQMTVPPLAKDGKIIITAPGGSVTSAANFVVVSNLPPTISTFSPVSGPPSTVVTITGTNYIGTTAVKFNLSSAAFIVNSATSITATVPVGATTGKVYITTPKGTGSSGGNFIVTAAAVPAVSTFTPVSGPAGTVVTITGTNLTGATGVKFNATPATFTVLTATSVRATVPAGATTGKVSVTTVGGTGSSAANFTITALVAARMATPASDLSTATAEAGSSTIKLVLRTALDGASAGSSENYHVTVDGLSVPVAGAAYDVVTNTVTLFVDGGALRAGGSAQVGWRNLSDRGGNALSGQSGAIKIR